MLHIYHAIFKECKYLSLALLSDLSLIDICIYVMHLRYNGLFAVLSTSKNYLDWGLDLRVLAKAKVLLNVHCFLQRKFNTCPGIYQQQQHAPYEHMGYPHCFPQGKIIAVPLSLQKYYFYQERHYNEISNHNNSPEKPSIKYSITLFGSLNTQFLHFIQEHLISSNCEFQENFYSLQEQIIRTQH